MAKRQKGGLGRGLDALLQSAPEEEPVTQEKAQFEEAVKAPSSKPERVMVFDEEIEEVVAAELKQAMQETQRKNDGTVAVAEASQTEPKEKEVGEETETDFVAQNIASTENLETEAKEKIPARTAEEIRKAAEKKKPKKRTMAGEAEREQAGSQEPPATAIQRSELLQAEDANVFEEAYPVEEVAIEEAQPPAAEEPELSTTPKEYLEVSIDAIEPNPNQPRTNFKKQELEELAASIEKDGLLQPILVRPIGENRYEIIAGERRWQACKEAGLLTVPVRVRAADDNEALELALIENIQRSDLNPIEEAYGYKRIMDRQKVTQSELAQMVSKGRSTIANSLRLLELPEDAQQLLYEEKITAGHARAILSVATAEGKQKLTERLVREKLSVRETENLARLLSGREKLSEAKQRVPAPKEFKMVAKELRTKYETNVRVKTVQGRNKIEIEFKDEDDLKRIFALMVGEE